MLVVTLIEIGLITPPVGMNVFVLNSILPQVSLRANFSGVACFALADVIRIALFLPSLMQAKGIRPMTKPSLTWLLAGATVLAGHAASADDVTLRFSNWLPPTQPIITRMVEPWAADVKKATEGRVKVLILPALGAAPAHFDLVQNGIADIAFGVSSRSPERFKLTEACDQVSRGIIDGMFQNHITVIDFNMTQYLPQVFILPGGFSASSQFLVMNEAAWDRIAPEDQAAIEALSGEALVRRFSGEWQADNSAALARLEEAGVTVHRIEGAELDAMHERLAFVEAGWIEEASALGVDGAAAVTHFRAELEKVAEELGVPVN